MVTGLRRAGSSPAPGTLHIAARPSAARGQRPCDPGRPLLDHRSPAPWRSAPPGVRPPCHGDPTPVPHITPPWRRAPNPSPHIAAPPRRPRHRKGDEVKRYTPPSPTSSRSPRRGVAPVLSRRAALGLGLVVGGAAALPGSAALAAPGGRRPLLRAPTAAHDGTGRARHGSRREGVDHRRSRHRPRSAERPGGSARTSRRPRRRRPRGRREHHRQRPSHPPRHDGGQPDRGPRPLGPRRRGSRRSRARRVRAGHGPRPRAGGRAGRPGRTTRSRPSASSWPAPRTSPPCTCATSR